MKCIKLSPSFYFKLVVSFRQPLSKILDFGLPTDYTIQSIGCDSIQTCSFVSERFQSQTMIYREFKRIDQINRTVYNQPKVTPAKNDVKVTPAKNDVDSVLSKSGHEYLMRYHRSFMFGENGLHLSWS